MTWEPTILVKRHADLISAPAASGDPRACWGLVLPGLFITGRERMKGGTFAAAFTHQQRRALAERQGLKEKTGGVGG